MLFSGIVYNFNATKVPEIVDKSRLDISNKRTPSQFLFLKGGMCSSPFSKRV